MIQAALRILGLASSMPTIPELLSEGTIENSMSESAHLVLSLPPIPPPNMAHHATELRTSTNLGAYSGNTAPLLPHGKLLTTRYPVLGRENNSRPITTTLRFFWSV